MRSVKIIKSLLVAVALPILASAATHRYIVELSTEPAARFASRNFGEGKAALMRPEVEKHRAAIRAQQDTVAASIRSLGGVVLSRTDTASNTLAIELPEEKAASLSSIAGVTSYQPARIHRAKLDQASVVHNFPQVYSQIGGMSYAGAGIKIAMIDSGIDITQPAFSDSGFQAPPGFPKVNATSDTKYTNNKVIVARSYYTLWVNPSDPDPSASDEIGHGTSTADCAAGGATVANLNNFFGETNLGTVTFTGAAPGAYLGSYKVFDSLSSDGASDAAILAAIDDAVNDGMDVINYSLGSGGPALPAALDPVAVALNNAVSSGLIVAAAAGDDGDGDDPNNPIQADSVDGLAYTIPELVSTEGGLNVISVGGSSNQRAFGAALTVGSVKYLVDPEYSLTTDQNNNFLTFSGLPIIDVATLDGTGQACSALPARSLVGAIALVRLDGFDPSADTCDPDMKMDNALNAGAVAGIISDWYPEDFYDIANQWSNYYGSQMGFLYYTNLPSGFITYSDGVALRAQLSATSAGTLDYNTNSVPLSSNRVAFLSSRGPSVDFDIKPDLVAVGEDLLTAAESINSNGDFYSPDGLLYPANGTSGSAPLVAGTAAILKAARPGLSVLEYRSLIINSAAPISDVVNGGLARVMDAGSGLLDANGALNAEATVVPSSLSFGTGSGSSTLTKTFTVTNRGTASDTFNLIVKPRDPGFMPQVSPTTLQLAPGASGTVQVTIPGGVLTSGEYEGAIHIQGNNTATDTHIVYWFGVPSSTPYMITDLGQDQIAYFPRGQTTPAGIAFRITDASGIYLTNILSQVAVTYQATYNSTTGNTIRGNAKVSAPYYLTDTTNPNYSPGVIAADVTTSTAVNAVDYFIVTVGNPSNPTLELDLYIYSQ